MVEAMRVELTPLPTARAVGATNMSMPYSETQRAARSARPRKPCSCPQPQPAAAGAHGGNAPQTKRHAIEHSTHNALVVGSSNLVEGISRGRGPSALV